MLTETRTGGAGMVLVEGKAADDAVVAGTADGMIGGAADAVAGGAPDTDGEGTGAAGGGAPVISGEDGTRSNLGAMTAPGVERRRRSASEKSAAEPESIRGGAWGRSTPCTCCGAAACGRVRSVGGPGGPDDCRAASGSGRDTEGGSEGGGTGEVGGTSVDSASRSASVGGGAEPEVRPPETASSSGVLHSTHATVPKALKPSQVAQTMPIWKSIGANRLG